MLAVFVCVMVIINIQYAGIVMYVIYVLNYILTNEQQNKKQATIETETHAISIHDYYLFV